MLQSMPLPRRFTLRGSLHGHIKAFPSDKHPQKWVLDRIYMHHSMVCPQHELRYSAQYCCTAPDSSAARGRYLDGTGSDQALDGGQNRQGVAKRLLESKGVRLKAFGIYIGRNKLYDALWDADLVGWVEIVPTVDDADFIIHRHSGPGEKQFQVQDWRKAAKEGGLPFVSVNAATASEVQEAIIEVLSRKGARLRGRGKRLKQRGSK